MNILKGIDNVSYDIMGSGMVKLVYFAIILVCIVFVVQSLGEGFRTYTSGASQRFSSEQSSSNQLPNFRDEYATHKVNDFYPAKY